MVWIEEGIAFLGGEARAALLVSVCSFALLLCFGIGKFFFWLGQGVAWIRRRKKARKARRLEAGRRLQFTLPDRENNYVQSRVYTALNVREEEEQDPASVGVRLEHSKKMLACLRQSALSPVERLEVEELAKILALYVGKEKWSGEDLRGMNEVFARLLKLSAKYQISLGLERGEGERQAN